MTQTARIVAMEVLNRLVSARDYAGPVLNKLLNRTADKQRTVALVLGTIRNRTAIDTVITEFAGRPVSRIQKKLLTVIRIAVYELIYCPKSPDYSIVNDAVNNAKTAAAKKQAGFVNAVLRRILRHIKNRNTRPDPAGEQQIIPRSVSAGCEFDRKFLPNPKASAEDFFSTAFSLPKWLIEDWLERFGFKKTRSICFASNRKASVYIRVNTLKITRHQLLEKFRNENIEFQVPPDELMIKLRKPKNITELFGFQEGLFSVQDVTASQPVRLLMPEPGWKILDMCAAPGGKTTQLAEFTADKAEILATDINDKRLGKVTENIARLGIKSVTVTGYEKLREKAAASGLFDCILLDVPCSNTAVMARRPEVRYRIKPQTIRKLTKTQLDLLNIAAQMLKPQGRICYSTCSIQNDENNLLVERFLRKSGSFKLKAEKLVLPSAGRFDCDGGYTAILTKK